VLLLTRLVKTTGIGHRNSKKIVESYSYEFRCFIILSADVQELGQRANGGWLNGHFPNVFKRKSVVLTRYFSSGNYSSPPLAGGDKGEGEL